MTPLLCVKYLKVGAKARAERYGSRFYGAYRSVLLGLLRNRWLTICGVLAIFVATLATFRFVPQLFFPSADRTFFTAQLYLPTGVGLDAPVSC